MNISIVLILLLFESSVESKQWTEMINKTHDWSIDYSQQLRQQFLSMTKSQNISIACNASIWQTVNGIQNLEVWAIDMINSWGSFPPSGVRTGTVSDFGAYDQCLAIEPNSMIDRPQYCLIDWRPPLPRPMPVHHNLHHTIDVLPKDFDIKQSFQNVFTNYSEFASFFYWITLRTGICTPSKCSQNDINSLAEGFADSYGLELNGTHCETKPTKTTITPIQVIAILFLMGTIILSISATILEQIKSKNEKMCGTAQVVNLFSLKQNVNYLLAKRSSDALPCIHGIRVFSIIWVVFGHTMLWMNYQLFSRAFRVKEIFSQIETQLAINGHFSVETFFFVSGLLSTYITLHLTGGQSSRFSLIAFILLRIVRLLPQLLIFILLTFLLPLGGWASGPIWNETITPEINNCANNWWTNMLFIQNWVTYDDICGVHTWYVGADMQLHWLSTLFMIPLLYCMKFGFRLLCAGIIGFYISSIIISYSLNLAPGMLFTGMDDHFWVTYMNYFFFKPWSHTTVYFTGFLLGIIAYKKMFKKLNLLPRIIILTLVMIGFVLSLLDTFYWNTGKPFNRILSAFVFGTDRLLWSLSLSGLIWMCISGNGGIFNSFLSAHVFTPFSRLTYSAYLVHAWVLWIFIGSRRERIDTNMGDIFYIFIHHTILTYFIAFIFALLFEVPVLRFLSLMSKMSQPKQTEDRTQESAELRDKLNVKTINNNEIELPEV